MKRLLLVFFTGMLSVSFSYGQSFNVDDLITLASLPSKNIDRFMGRNGFALKSDLDDSSLIACFEQKMKRRSPDTISRRSIDLYQKHTSRFFCFHTNVLQEFKNGQDFLIKKGFIFDTTANLNTAPSIIFQKRNVVIEATRYTKDNAPAYTFKLEEKAIPQITNIKYANDLLQFDSHEFLSSFFGIQNVKRDLYYFSENELKKCSVLFGKSSRQVVFVWGDEVNLNKLSYILVTKVAPTVEAVASKWVIAKNEWKLGNGIYPGMTLRELLLLNESDFEIYGSQSEMGFMVKPSDQGKINFTTTGVMLNCQGCNEENIFNKKTLSALSVAKENLPMFVYDVIIFPETK
ncbi:MAG: hypothetical protein ABIR19_04685 [Ginsengibacter sp.]